MVAVLEASDDAGLPRIAVSPQQGKFLSLLASAIQARRILEIGTLGGFSSIWLARGAGPRGRVLTLESDPKYAAVARRNFERAGVADRVEVLVGAALESLPTLIGDPFDLIFVDADRNNYVEYLNWAVKLGRPGSIVLVDNVIGGGHVLTAGDAGATAVRQMLKIIGEHPRLDGVSIQTVGAKNWDGFALALVR